MIGFNTFPPTERSFTHLSKIITDVKLANGPVLHG